MPPIGNDLIIDGEFFQKSRKLALYIIKKHQHQIQKRDTTGEKLYELCNEVKYKHDMFFENVGLELGLNENNFELLSKTVMSQVLNGSCNFGRIVSIYAFCLALFDYSEKSNLMGNKAESIASMVALTIQTHLEWFKNNGGWDGFIEHFSPHEDKVWRNVMFTTFGLGAVAGLILANS